MIIEVIKREGRRGVLILRIDEGEWGEIHSAIFGQRPAFPNQIDTLEEWEDLFRLLEIQNTKKYVLKRLAERPFHSAELTKSLRERLVSDQTIDLVIEEYLQMGYLNDVEWVDSFIRGHLRKRHSLQTIAWKMQARGVPADIAKQATQELKDPEAEKESIRYLLSTRYRSRNLLDRRDKEKVISSLMRKGFSFDSIKYAILNFDK